MPAPASFQPAPRWVWRPDEHDEPSTPLHCAEDAAWAGGASAVGIGAAGWWLQHHPWPLGPWLATPGGIATAVTALAVGGALAWLAVRTPQDRIRHLAGPRLWEGAAGRTQAGAWARAQGGTPHSVHLHAAVPLSARIWTRHLLIHGSVGSGKTQILAGVVRQVSADARSRMLLADAKGDWTSLLPDAALLCPWDARSAVWDLAAEIRSLADCASLAQALIPENPDPRMRFWSSTSRAVVEAALRTLHAERKQAWGWADLRDLLRRPARDIIAATQAHHPVIAQVLGGGETVTGSILASVASETRLVDVAAWAWPTRPEEPAQRWSVRRWLSGGCGGLPRRVVIQAGEDQAASRGLLGLALTLTARRVLSPVMPESPNTVRVWIVLDELAAAGRLDDLPALIERGRSKGVALLAGLQDLEQIAALYGRETASSLTAMIGGQIVCQVGAGPTRDRVADVLGKRRVSVPTHSSNSGGAAQTHTRGRHEESRGLVLPAQLSSCLGPWTDRRTAQVRAVLAPSGGDAYVLDWPIVPLPMRRPPHVAAPWTQASGAVPTPVPAPVTTPVPTPVEPARTVVDVGRMFEPPR